MAVCESALHDCLYGGVSVLGAMVTAIDQMPGETDLFSADRFGAVAVKWVPGVETGRVWWFNPSDAMLRRIPFRHRKEP